MGNLTLREVHELKKTAEANMLSAISQIFEQFKHDSGLINNDQSISVHMEYAHSVGHRLPEAVIESVEIDMKVFD